MRDQRCAATTSASTTAPGVGAESFTHEERIASTTAILQAHEAQAESGQAGPEPPVVAAVGKPAEEGQERDRRDRPQDASDSHRPDAVHVERLDLGDAIGPLAEFELSQIRTTELVAPGRPLQSSAFAVTDLALDGLRPVAVSDRPVFLFTHMFQTTPGVDVGWTR